MIRKIQHKSTIAMLSLIITALLSISESSCQKDSAAPTEPQSELTIPDNSNPQLMYDYFVKNANELIQATAKAKAGEVIYISDTAKIDLSSQKAFSIPGGVTLMSGRYKINTSGNLVNGAKLYTTNLGHAPLIRIKGDKVKLVGLRIIGPDTLRRTEEMRSLGKEGKYYSIPVSQGIVCDYDNLEIANCEIAGWSHAGVYFTNNAKGAYIHDSYIHHNQREGLGYGICLKGASDIAVKYNIFDWNRHSIAASGLPGESYEAAFNTVLQNGNSHGFDMHGGKNRKDGTNIAGTLVNIHHNIFYLQNQKAILVNGVPTDKVIIQNNNFVHSSFKEAVRLDPATTSSSMQVSDNTYNVPNKKVTISLKSF